jgi:hypothetical protein
MLEIAKKIFQPRDGHLQFGYCRSQEWIIHRYRPYIALDPLEAKFDDEAVTPLLKKRFKNVDLLGPYEKRILHSLISNTESLKILLGSRGCGKTATLLFLESFIGKNTKVPPHKKQPLNVYIDCNGLMPLGTRPADIRRDLVIKNLSDRLRSALLRYADELFGLARVALDSGEILRDDFFQQLLLKIYHQVPSGRRPNQLDFLSALHAVMDGLSIDNQLRFSLNMFGLLWSTGKHTVSFVCFDNIDQFELSIQSPLSDWLKSLVSVYRLPIIVALRIISRNKYEGGGLRHTDIPHSGISPIAEVGRRAKLLLDGEYGDFNDFLHDRFEKIG